jgi:hypothetical protein
MFLTMLTTALVAAAKTPQWTDYVANGKASAVIHATGYSVEVLSYAWDKYADELIAMLADLRNPICLSDELVSAYWFLALVFIHQYPRWNKLIPNTLHTRITGRVSVQKFYSIVVPILCTFSECVNEIKWEERLNPLNHGTHFMKERFTTIFDGTNINVQNVSNKKLNRVLFSGSKYNHCCLKIMIGITFMGTIVHYTGPHIGTMHDATILKKYPPNFEEWEWGMGDGAFEDNYHILVKYQQPAGGVLTEAQVYMNGLFNYWRVRVEHIIREVKRHDMFCGVYRGSYGLLKSAIDLTVHMTNIKIKCSLPRYETCGPWGHEPGSYQNKRARTN